MASDGFNQSEVFELTLGFGSGYGVVERRWNNIQGNTVADFLASSEYRSTPDLIQVLSKLETQGADQDRFRAHPGDFPGTTKSVVITSFS